jgi:prepilin peptidase CpaA
MDAFLALALVATAIAAVIDWRTGEIPDWLTLGPLAIAPVGHFAVGLMAPVPHAAKVGMVEAGLSVGGALLCGLVPALFALGFFAQKGATGGGDLKMFAAVGALLLPMRGIEAELYGFVAAALILPIRLAWEGRLMRVLSNSAVLAINPFLPKSRRREIHPEAMTSVRFAPAIFAGVLLEAASIRWGGS